MTSLTPTKGSIHWPATGTSAKEVPKEQVSVQGRIQQMFLLVGSSLYFIEKHSIFDTQERVLSEPICKRAN